MMNTYESLEIVHGLPLGAMAAFSRLLEIESAYVSDVSGSEAFTVLSKELQEFAKDRMSDVRLGGVSIPFSPLLTLPLLALDQPSNPNCQQHEQK